MRPLYLLTALACLATARPFNDDARQMPLVRPSRVPDLAELASTLSSDLLLQLEAHVLSLPEKRLLRWSDGFEQWVTEGEKALIVLEQHGRKFVDVTDGSVSARAGEGDAIPTEIRYGNKTLGPLFADISLDRMRKRLTKFTSFRTRYYRSSTGRDSQKWLLAEVKRVAATGSAITVSEFEHSWGQNTIMARIEPHNLQRNDTGAVIIGAHQDSTNLLPFLPAPGADDDGSGTVTILEAFSILAAQAWQPLHRPVEFHWYSAEEGGMLGSGEVARAYHAASTLVSAFVQFDMTAFVKKGTPERVGIVTDFVHPNLSAFNRLLVDEYLDIGWVDTKCGYACSDHASWTSVGVPSAFSIEGAFADSNPNIHTGRDRLDVEEFSFSHMGQFCRLALSYLVEVAGSKF